MLQYLYGFNTSSKSFMGVHAQFQDRYEFCMSSKIGIGSGSILGSISISDQQFEDQYGVSISFTKVLFQCRVSRNLGICFGTVMSSCSVTVSELGQTIFQYKYRRDQIQDLNSKSYMIDVGSRSVPRPLLLFGVGRLV